MKSITALVLLLGSIAAASAQYNPPQFQGYQTQNNQGGMFQQYQAPPMQSFQAPSYQAPRQCSIQCQDIGFQRNCHEVCY
jgi:hypothetical protein